MESHEQGKTAFFADFPPSPVDAGSSSAGSGLELLQNSWASFPLPPHPVVTINKHLLLLSATGSLRSLPLIRVKLFVSLSPFWWLPGARIGGYVGLGNRHFKQKSHNY